MGTKSNSARTRTRRGRKGRACLSSHLCQGPGAARRAGDDLTAYGSAASWRDGSDCCDRAARPWPQDSDLRGRALGAAVHVRSTPAARKAAASILVSCASPFEAHCQCVMKNSCELPHVYHRAAEVLLLQKSIAMAADAATGLCTPQALLRRRGLVGCPTACVQYQQSWDATVPHESLGRRSKCDTFLSMRFLGTCQRCLRGAQGALHHGVGCLASLAAEEDFWTITLLLRPQRHLQMSARRRPLAAIVHEGDHAAAIASGDPSFVDSNHT
jgi:hypothetical protein